MLFDLIQEKNALVRQYKGKSAQLDKWIRQSDLWFWIYSYYQTKGIHMSKRDIMDILEGKIAENASVDAYTVVPGFQAMEKDMRSCVEMGSSADAKLLHRWYEEAFGEAPVMRENNPVIYEWELLPSCHFNEIPEALDQLFKQANSQRLTGTSVERAAKLHLEFLRIYPFGENSYAAAFILLMYSLMEAGLPLPRLNLTDREYNQYLANFYVSGDALPFTEMLERALVNRLEAILSVCYSIPEKEEND